MKKQNKETSNIFSLTITEVEAIVRSIYQNCKPSKNRYNMTQKIAKGMSEYTGIKWYAKKDEDELYNIYFKKEENIKTSFFEFSNVVIKMYFYLSFTKKSDGYFYPEENIEDEVEYQTTITEPLDLPCYKVENGKVVKDSYINCKTVCDTYLNDKSTETVGNRFKNTKNNVVYAIKNQLAQAYIMSYAFTRTVPRKLSLDFAGKFVDGNGTFLIEKIADYVVENQM